MSHDIFAGKEVRTTSKKNDEGVTVTFDDDTADRGGFGMSSYKYLL